MSGILVSEKLLDDGTVKSKKLKDLLQKRVELTRTAPLCEDSRLPERSAPLDVSLRTNRDHNCPASR